MHRQVDRIHDILTQDNTHRQIGLGKYLHISNAQQSAWDILTLNFKQTDIDIKGYQVLIMSQVLGTLYTCIKPRCRLYNYFHFTNKEAKTQKNEVSCLRSRQQKSHSNSGLHDSKDLGHFYTALLLLLLLLSHFSRVRLCATPQTAAHQAPHPQDSPGKNTGVGCHFLLQCMKVKSESEVTLSCPTLSDPMDCSLLGSSVHGIFQARVLEQGAIAFSDTALILV